MLEFELSIVKLFQSLSNPLLDLTIFGITQLGDQMFFILISVIMYWTVHKRYAFYFVFTFMISAILNAGLKLMFMRLRPYNYEGINMLESWRTEGYSFPSGHAQAAGVLGFYGLDASKKLKSRILKILAIFILITVPLSRVYLGQHFLSDVIVGALLAFGIAYVCYKGLLKIGNKEAYLALALIPLMILLMLLNPTHDIGVASGAFVGFAFGYFIEKNYVNYNVKDIWYLQILKVIIGLSVLMGIRLGLGAIFPDLPWFDFIRYLVIGLWASLFAPMVFKYGLQKIF